MSVEPDAAYDALDLEHIATPEKNGPPPLTPPLPNAKEDDWDPLDLTDPAWDQPAREPDLHTFIYSGLRHVISGPPEVAKTLVAYDAIVKLVQQGRRCSIIDFEMGVRRAKLMLRELGATIADLTLVQFIAPETKPAGKLQRVIEWRPALVTIDASAGAFAASGLDDNKRGDVERFAAEWIRPLWLEQIATLTVDHVTKVVEGRGGFAIGSERKVGGTDVHIGLALLNKRALTRGGRATVEATVHKDRPGFLHRPIVSFIDVVSGADHEITVSYRAPEPMEHTESGKVMPTIKMAAVSLWLSDRRGEWVTRNDCCVGIGGNKAMALAAVNALVELGYVAERPEGGVRFVRLYKRPREPAGA